MFILLQFFSKDGWSEQGRVKTWKQSKSYEAVFVNQARYANYFKQDNSRNAEQYILEKGATMT